MKTIALFFILIIIARGTSGEVYKGIMPSFVLNDVKKLFPNATFEKMNPAWAKENDALYKVLGPGLSGTIVIKLTSYKETFKSSAQHVDSLIEADSLLSPDTLKWDERFKSKRANFRKFSESDWKSFQEYTEDSMEVSWVRWVPDSKIPVKRFIIKYGKPDTTNYSDDDLTPYKYWKRGISVYYDDKEIVEKVDFDFTYEDEKNDYLIRNNVKVLPELVELDLRFKYGIPLDSSPKKKSTRQRSLSK
jgi:hypothetical protein